MKKARRIIYNKAFNDFNDEPEYKLQKVRIYGEDDDKYIIDSYSKFEFKCDKSQVFLNKEDFRRKMDNIKDFKLLESEKEYLLKQF